MLAAYKICFHGIDMTKKTKDDLTEDFNVDTDRNNWRRKALKFISTAGGAVTGLAVFQGKWVNPVIESVVLPAHAQTSTDDDSTDDDCTYGGYGGYGGYGCNGGNIHQNRYRMFASNDTGEYGRYAHNTKNGESGVSLKDIENQSNDT